MSELSEEEKFIYDILREKGSIKYTDLQRLCEEEFEGVRLILKKMKEKGFIDYEGNIPGFSSEISFLG